MIIAATVTSLAVLWASWALAGTTGSGNGNRDSLVHVWDEIVSRSVDTAQCQTCAHLRESLEKTVTETEIKQIRIEALKQTILKRLGLTEPPKFSSPSKPLPHPIKDGTLSLEKEQLAPFQPVTERVIMLFTNHDCLNDERDYTMHLRLDIPTNLRRIEISEANMWVYTGMENLESCLMLSYLCGEDHKKHVVPMHLSAFKSGWSKMDITWTLSSWLEFGSLCHEVELKCDFPTICEEPIATDPSKKPFIHVDIAPNDFQTKREKRNLNCGKETTECCRESLQVSFKDIGWDDWIIQPTDYNAYYCRGTCANAATISLSKAPYHTVVRKYNLIPHKHMDVVPCCTPARLSPLQIIYKDQNNTFLQRIIQDLTVESCGCM
ncbi:TGFB [Nesidiocoris tenuis]|uniref:TGFB n=1 Tax=Nesidiocoris tenuis TaxID=355587 RepID=A0ABN7AEN2_9HEMI|nr:TGFB [Nesidiocoris tenuis]